MRALAFLLLLAASGAISASEARSQTIVVYGGPGCVSPESVRLLARGVAGLGGPDAISTDGFGVRLTEASGEMAGLRTASILDDAVLAWRPTMGPGAAVACPRPQVLREGWTSVRVAAEAGNETGDPGPLRYLDPSLPNVDKIGPDYEATVQIQNRALVAARWRDFLPTDPAIASRVFEAVDGRFPKRKGLAMSAALAPTRWATVYADALGAEDLPFESTLGREVPVRRQRLGGGVRLDDAYHSGWSAGLALRAERLERPEWSALASGIGPDWRETLAEASLGRHADLSPDRRLVLDGTLRQRQATGPSLRDGSVSWGQAGVALVGRRIDALARLSVGASGIGGEASGEVRAGNYARGGSARAFVRRMLPEAQPDLFFWVARGYTGLASAQTPLALDGVPRPEEHVGLRVDASLFHYDDSRIATATSFSVDASGEVDSRRGETVFLPQFTLAPEAVAVSGPVRAVAASGAMATAEAMARWERGNVVFDGVSTVFTRLTGWARVALPLTGDDAFRDARCREPTVRAGLHAEHSPDGLLNLNARLEWRAATRWEGWPEPDVPAALLLDLGLSRSFSDDRWHVALTGRNVLAAPEQTHPLGATLDGRLFVRLEARF